MSKLMRSLIESYYEFVRSFRKIVDADVLFVQYCLGMLGMLGAVKFLLYTYPGLQKNNGLAPEKLHGPNLGMFYQ